MGCFYFYSSFSLQRRFVVSSWGPSIKDATLFLANFDPLPLSHFVTHRGTLSQKVRHTSRTTPPRFLVGLVQKTRTKAPVKILSQLFAGIFFRGVLSGSLLSGRFCSEWFLSIPHSVRIHLLQQKV